MTKRAVNYYIHPSDFRTASNSDRAIDYIFWRRPCLVCGKIRIKCECDWVKETKLPPMLMEMSK